MATVSGTVTDKSGNVAPWSVDFTVGTAPRPGIRVGASHKMVGKNDPVPLENAMGLVPPQQLDMFRCYDDVGPAANWSGIDFAQYVGKRPMWWSCKGDVASYSNPSSSVIANAKNLARTYNPDWPPMMWTIWHEVEAKLVDAKNSGTSSPFTFAQFKTMWEAFYSQVKPLCPPNLTLGVIHGGYGWRVGSDTTTNSGTFSATPAEWRALPSDFQAIDNYGGPQVEDLTDMARLKRFVTEMCGGDWSKLCIAESGMRQDSLMKQAGAVDFENPTDAERARAELIGIDWIKRNGDKLGNLNVKVWCYWNSTATEDPGPMTPNECLAFGDVWRKWSINRP